jgi:hypothetical protein
MLIGSIGSICEQLACRTLFAPSWLFDSEDSESIGFVGEYFGHAFHSVDGSKQVGCLSNEAVTIRFSDFDSCLHPFSKILIGTEEEVC